MNNEIKLFSFENEGNELDKITTVNIDGDIWFLVNDVCKALGLENVTRAIESLDDDEKNTFTFSKGIPGNPTRLIISESGLYSLIFKSQKENAKKFRKWITSEVIPSIRKTGGYQTPNFMLRYNLNRDAIDKGYFSVIGMLYTHLYSQFERKGYIIPEKALNGKEIRPDNSVGILFAKYLKEEYPEHKDKYKMYVHTFPNGSQFECRQYKNELMGIFADFVDEVWIPLKAEDYFLERDVNALPYLNKILGIGVQQHLLD